MTEKLLQFLWRLQYFNTSSLITTQGQSLQILHPGIINTNQGPDFFNARILINNITWAGAVELHLLTSAWERHGHTGDSHYDNVVLHVVWQHDKDVNDIPVLELCSRVPKVLLEQYNRWMESAGFIPCASRAAAVPGIVWKSWKERLAAERLQRKADGILAQVEKSKGHWEEVCWWQMARAFGGVINGDSFGQIAASLPITLLAKCKASREQTECLLLGQAGLLSDHLAEQDSYLLHLAKEYRHLQLKYSLQPVAAPLYYFRMRPPAFPDTRLAQLAALVYQAVHLFSKIREEKELTVVKSWLSSPVSSYWQHHYRAGVRVSKTISGPGRAFVDHVVINTVCPLLYAYGHYHTIDLFKEKAITWLLAAAAENNHITRQFAAAGVSAANALESQALIELKTNYCTSRRCLDCAAGASLLRCRE